MIDAHQVRRARFDDLTARELHDILRLRAEVFVVEQECVFLEIDGRDHEPDAEHLWSEDERGLTGVARVLHEHDDVWSIGRVVTRPDVRSTGVAARLVAAALAVVDEHGADVTLLKAQSHLAGWYRRFGFEVSGPEFVEDGIPHVPMARPTPTPTGRAVSLVPLDAGVHAWLADEPGDGFPNAGLVVDEDAATVIDTLCVPSQTEAFVAAIDELGLRVRRAVLTGSTIEFVGGTARFTMSAVYGRRQTSVHLDQPPTPDIYRRILPAVAAELDDELATKPVSHVVQEPAQLTPALALHPFAGSQDENLVAVVAGAGICFAGAMASFGVTPRCYQGDPVRWADELDRLVALAPVIVPGHGPIGGEEEVRDLQGYLRACAAADGDPAAVPSGPWDAWRHREHDEVNVERAAMLARGDTSIPPSMLRIAGLA